jgi:hypothetical protein
VFAEPAPTTGTCAPVAGQLAESINVQGMPKAVGITQFLEGKLLFEHFVTPVYEIIRPNGPGCEPTCRRARAHWTLR